MPTCISAINIYYCHRRSWKPSMPSTTRAQLAALFRPSFEDHVMFGGAAPHYSGCCAHCWAQRARTFHQSYIFYSAFLNRLCLYICSICKLLICYIKPVQYHVLSWIQLSGGCGGRWSCFMALGNQMDTYNMLSYLYWMRQMVFTDSFEPGEGYIPGGGHTFDIPTCEYPGGLWLWYISS